MEGGRIKMMQILPRDFSSPGHETLLHLIVCVGLRLIRKYFDRKSY